MKLIFLTLTTIFLSLTTFATGIGPITGFGNVCIGANDTLSNTFMGGVWSSGNLSVATVDPVSGIVTGLSAGTTTITYILGTDTATTTINVNALPAPYTVTGGGSYCADSSGVSIGLTGSELGVSYLLDYSPSVTGYAPATGGAIDFGTLTVPGVYTVLATNVVTGCTSAMTGSATVSITPLITPMVSILLAPGDTVCQGTSVLLNTSATNAGSTPNYLWNVNGINVAIGNTYNFIPANGDKVTVYMTADTACANTEYANGSVTLTVLPYKLPTASISVNPADTVCQYAAAQFSVEGFYGGQDPVYNWRVNGVNEGTGNVFNYFPNSGDVIDCQLESDYQCRLANTVNSNPVTMTVVPLLLPSVAIIPNPGFSVLLGGYDTLTAVVTNGGTSPTYQWEINGVPVIGATSSVFVSNLFRNYDSVTCIVTSSGFCDGLSTLNWVFISVTPTGVTQVSNQANDIQLFPNPNSGTFNVRGPVGTVNDENVSIQVSDMLGHIVYQRAAVAIKGNLTEQLSLGDILASGMYILNIQSSRGSKIFHFVVTR